LTFGQFYDYLTEAVFAVVQHFILFYFTRKKGNFSASPPLQWQCLQKRCVLCLEIPIGDIVVFFRC